QGHMWWSAWIRAYVCAPMRAYRCACPSSTMAALSSSMARLPDMRPKRASKSAALRQRAGLWVRRQNRLMRCMFIPLYVATGVPTRAWHAFCRPDTSRHKTTRRMFSRQEPCQPKALHAWSAWHACQGELCKRCALLECTVRKKHAYAVTVNYRMGVQWFGMARFLRGARVYRTDRPVYCTGVQHGGAVRGTSVQM